jgi:hypothetical protein
MFVRVFSECADLCESFARAELLDGSGPVEQQLQHATNAAARRESDVRRLVVRPLTRTEEQMRRIVKSLMQQILEPTQRKETEP